MYTAYDRFQDAAAWVGTILIVSGMMFTVGTE